MQRALAIALLLGATSCQHAAPAREGAAAALSPSQRALAIADALVDQSLADSPAALARLRPPGARHDALPDQSLAAEAARDRREDAWLAELRALQPQTLSATAQHAHDLALALLEARVAQRICQRELWPVSQVGPALLVNLADAALAQPLETPELRAQALTRWALFPRAVDDEIAALRAGLARGVTAPRVVVDHVLAQLATLIAAPDAELPFASPAFHADDEAFRARFLALVARDVRPALARYRDFLRDTYAPRARASIAMSDGPGGRGCYEASLLLQTTLEITPEEVHARGHAALAEIEAEIAAISARSFGGIAPRELLTKLRSDPAFLYRDEAHLMRVGQAAMDRAWAALPRAFTFLPRSRAILEPIPAFQAKTAAAHYLQAALDGSKPAAYRVRTFAPEKQSWATGENTAFHEIVPGHHLQIALANEREDLPRIARLMFRSGFTEGWALYAERVADELRLYSSDADRLGMLNGRAWRAVRLVVDSGMHALGWNRERALTFMLEHTALSPDQAAQEIDRYIARPAQATAYLLGYQEIAALREEAELTLGARFDLREFHEIVLGGGSTTLPLLRARVSEWLAETRGAGEPSPLRSAAPLLDLRDARGERTECTKGPEATAYRARLEAALVASWRHDAIFGYAEPAIARVSFAREPELRAIEHSRASVADAARASLAAFLTEAPPPCLRGSEAQLVVLVPWSTDLRSGVAADEREPSEEATSRFRVEELPIREAPPQRN
jgi:uncharacterized protein (DUF885 family)